MPFEKFVPGFDPLTLPSPPLGERVKGEGEIRREAVKRSIREPMRVLGIDPGTLEFGIGIVEGTASRSEVVTYETVKISKSDPIAKRLRVIYESILDFIRRYEPQVLALENVFFGKDVRALVKMGEARACAMLAAEESGVPVVEYPPARVKEAVSGNGRASKIQIQQMVRHLLRLKEVPPEDAADALAVALCHLQSENVRIPVG